MHILITGISSGIGKYLAESLGNEHEISGFSRRPTEVRTKHSAELDITDTASATAWATDVSEREGKPFDAVILNAGCGEFATFEKTMAEDIGRMISTNLTANILFIQGITPLLSKKPIVIGIGSYAGKSWFSGGAAYQASKFGFRGFLGALKKEWKHARIHLVNPKIVRTGFFGSNPAPVEYGETSLEEIAETVKKCLAGGEARFEIDL